MSGKGVYIHFTRSTDFFSVYSITHKKIECVDILYLIFKFFINNKYERRFQNYGRESL